MEFSHPENSFYHKSVNPENSLKNKNIEVDLPRTVPVQATVSE